MSLLCTLALTIFAPTSPFCSLSSSPQATVSPLARDLSHSLSTLSYAAPLRVAVGVSKTAGWEVDPLDPAYWDHARSVQWLQTKARALGLPPTTVAALCPGGVTGSQLVRWVKLRSGSATVGISVRVGDRVSCHEQSA